MISINSKFINIEKKEIKKYLLLLKVKDRIKNKLIELSIVYSN